MLMELVFEVQFHLAMLPSNSFTVGNHCKDACHKFIYFFLVFQFCGDLSGAINSMYAHNKLSDS